MSNIRAVGMMLLDELFEMGGAFVPNFSDRTFPQFFAEQLNIDIDAAIFARHGPLHSGKFAMACGHP